MSNNGHNIEKTNFDAFINAVGSAIQQAQVRLDVYKRQTDGGSDIELSLNAMYLELPVMLNYHIRLAPKVAVIPFAGSYGSLGVDGKQSFDDLGLEIQQNLFGKNKMFQRGDFGLSLIHI